MNAKHSKISVDNSVVSPVSKRGTFRHELPKIMSARKAKKTTKTLFLISSYAAAQPIKVPQGSWLGLPVAEFKWSAIHQKINRAESLGRSLTDGIIKADEALARLAVKK